MPSAKLRKAGVTKKKFDSCIKKVKSSNPGVNAYAVCHRSFYRSIAKKGKSTWVKTINGKI